MLWNLDPLWLLAFLPGVLGLAFWIRRKRIQVLRDYLEGFPPPEFLPAPKVALPFPKLWGVRAALGIGGGILLLLAWVGLPLGTREVPVRKVVRPVILIVDVSRSMDVVDIPFGRMASARLLARRVVTRLSGNPVGLLAAAGETHQLLPVAHDRDLLFRHLDALNSGLFTHKGTSLPGALKAALASMNGDRSGPNPVFLLISDGENHGDDQELLSLARRIRGLNGQVSAISVGSEEGGAVPPSDRIGPSLMSGGQPAETENGMPHSRARPELLMALAEAGGGTFARGEDPSSVASLLKEAESWGGGGETVAWESRAVEGWPWFLGFALLALFLELLLESVSHRVPALLKPERP